MTALLLQVAVCADFLRRLINATFNPARCTKCFRSRGYVFENHHVIGDDMAGALHALIVLKNNLPSATFLTKFPSVSAHYQSRKHGHARALILLVAELKKLEG